jgi:hypothetical protein
MMVDTRLSIVRDEDRASIADIELGTMMQPRTSAQMRCWRAVCQGLGVAHLFEIGNQSRARRVSSQTPWQINR